MRKYRRLTRDQRYQIEALLTSGSSLRYIARQLGTTASTISREIQKAKANDGNYCASKSHDLSLRNIHKPRVKSRKIRGQLEIYIREKILLDWSPEQIVGRMKYLKMKNGV